MGSSTEASAPEITESDSVNNDKTGTISKKTPDDVDVESVGWDAASTRKLIRKIDFTLIPFLALLYLLSFLDRTNIGNARLDTLEQDLHFPKGSLYYNDALAIFFPFYVAAEIPSNMAMKRFRPSIWIPSIMVAWALCTTLMGIVRDYPGLMVARSFLGLAEGGLFPGITY
jgi:MFS family permease